MKSLAKRCVATLLILPLPVLLFTVMAVRQGFTGVLIVVGAIVVVVSFVVGIMCLLTELWNH